jgi:hypothetical protein
MHIYLTRPSPGVDGGARMPSGEEQKPEGWNRIHLIVKELDGTRSSLKNLPVPGVRRLLNHVEQLVTVDGQIEIRADGLSFANALSHPHV